MRTKSISCYLKFRFDLIFGMRFKCFESLTCSGIDRSYGHNESLYDLLVCTDYSELLAFGLIGNTTNGSWWIVQVLATKTSLKLFLTRREFSRAFVSSSFAARRRWVKPRCSKDLNNPLTAVRGIQFSQSVGVS